MTLRMGTVAHHMLGDISREKFDYFWIDSEDDESYYGAWVTGFGFINVRFPKDTTRELTEDERLFHETHRVVIA